MKDHFQNSGTYNSQELSKMLKYIHQKTEVLMFEWLT